MRTAPNSKQGGVSESHKQLGKTRKSELGEHLVGEEGLKDGEEVRCAERGRVDDVSGSLQQTSILGVQSRAAGHLD